jgi:predicted N-acyltransferase
VLRRAIADYLARERREVRKIGQYYEEHSPYRKGEVEDHC